MSAGYPGEKMHLSEIDLLHLGMFAQGRADAAFATLRQEAPVFWNQAKNGGGFWALTKYHDILQAWKNPKVLSSEYGNMLRLHGHKDQAAGSMMVVTDPPRHTRLRALHHQAMNLQTVTITRQPEHVRSNFIAGCKHLFVRFDA